MFTVVSKSLVSKSAVVIQHWPIKTITNDITSILIGHIQISSSVHWQMTCKPRYNLDHGISWPGNETKELRMRYAWSLQPLMPTCCVSKPSSLPWAMVTQMQSRVCSLEINSDKNRWETPVYLNITIWDFCFGYTTDKSVSWNWEFSRHKFKLTSCLYIPPVEVKGEVFLLVLFVDELGQPCRGSWHAHPAPDGGVHSDLHHCCWWVATQCVETGAYVLVWVLLLLHMYKFTNWNLDILVTRR